MKMRSLAVGVLAGAFALAAGAGTVSWKGGDGKWSDANWDPAAPQAGDDVRVESGTVTLSAQTPALKSFTLTGSEAVLSFDDGVLRAPTELVAELRATDVLIAEGAVVTHATNTMQTSAYMALAEKKWKMNARVFITCENLTVDAQSKIDVNGRGFTQTETLNKTTKYGGAGPGGSTNVSGMVTTSGTPFGGAGHGGVGQWFFHKGSTTSWQSGQIYDSLTEPVWCGSCGDWGQRWSDSTANWGAPGGGAVRIAASGAVTLNGPITANSIKFKPHSGMGGSGGSIWISCRTITGTALLSANDPERQGGGGRIAVTYNAAAQDEITDQTLKFDCDGWDLGTVYFTDDRFLGSTFSATSNGLRNGRPFCGSWGRWQPENVTVNNVRIGFEDSNITNLTIAGTLTITGGNSLGRVNFGGDERLVWGGIENKFARASLNYRPKVTLGALAVKGQNACYVYAAATNGTETCGAELNVTGELKIDGTCDAWNWGWSAAIYPVCHPTNGAPVKITAGTFFERFTEGYGAFISANGHGYGSFVEPGKVDWIAYGPGVSTNYICNVSPSYGMEGQGGQWPDHGGAGGIRNDMCNASDIRCYGSVEKPTSAGTADKAGKFGGGVIWLEVSGALALTNASAKVSAADCGFAALAETGSAGGENAATAGSIYLKCRTIEVVQKQSKTLVNVDAAAVRLAPGRIAIDYDTSAQAALPVPSELRISAAPVFSSDRAYTWADMGTIWLPDDALFKNGFRSNTVYCGEVHLGNYTTWNPSSLTVDGARVRLPARTGGLDVAGDVTVFNQGQLSFGGGDYGSSNVFRRVPTTPGVGPVVRIGGNLTMSGVTGKYPRTQMEVFAGSSVGDDVRMGGRVEVKGDITLSDNAWILPTSREMTGESIKFEAKNVTIDGTSGFDASGRGYAGGAGKGGSASGPGAAHGPENPANGNGGSGGFGGHGGATAKELEWGVEYGMLKDCALTPGSGGCGGYTKDGTWNGCLDFRRFGGQGGGNITLYVLKSLNIAGSLLADGGSTVGNCASYGGGGGSGGGIHVCCRTWNPSGTPVIRAQGGAMGSRAGSFGGGGGRIVIRRGADTDPTPTAERTYATAPAGTTGNAAADYQPTDGTVYWGRWGGGFSVIVR